MDCKEPLGIQEKPLILETYCVFMVKVYTRETKQVCSQVKPDE